LLRELLGVDASLEPLYGRLHDHAGGNPFFVEEVVRELEQSGKLGGTRGAYRLVEPIERVILPATVQAVLAARMDRLPEPEKRLLQTAAVIGKSFSERVLSQVMTEVDVVAKPPDVSGAVRALIDAGFLFLSHAHPIEYAFKHPLTQEVAYQTQLGDRRKRVHGVTASTITDLDADKLDERAALLAHHWEMADRPWEAAIWNRRAADWAAGTDNAGAFRHLRKALDLLERIPSTTDAATLSLSTREGILRLGPFVNLEAEEAERIFTDGRRIAQQAADASLLVHLTSSYSYCRMMTGGIEEAHRYAQEAARLAQASGDQAMQTRVSLEDAQAAIWTGRLYEGLSIAEAALAAHRRGDSPLRGFSIGLGGEAFLLALRGLCLSYMGRAREGRQDLETAIVGARQDGSPEGLLVAHLFRSFGANVAGNTDEALPHARTALEIAMRLHHPFFAPLASAMLGTAQVFGGRWQEGKRTLEDLLAGDLGGMGMMIEPFVRTSLSLACLEAGEVGRARDGAARALALANERGVKTAECIALIGVSRVTLRIEGVAGRETVQRALDRAAELVVETGAYSFEPRIHIERAALALALGDAPARQRELERALQLAETMGVKPYPPELISSGEP
jgi:tetratricopeptide (TPR) repeat protein